MAKRMLSLALMLVASVSLALAGSPALQGDYVEVRSNHVLGGGCTYSAEADMDGNQAIIAWRVGNGDLAGLSVVAVILGEGNLQLGTHARETILFVDRKATAAQCDELVQTFTNRYTELFGTVKKVELTPISFRRDGLDHFQVMVPGQAKVVTRAMVQTDHEPSCDRVVWYKPFSNDATASLAQTAEHAYTGSDLPATWTIPNKRSAYVGSFSFAPELAAR